MTDTRPTAREINDAIRYTCWAVFARPEPSATAPTASGLRNIRRSSVPAAAQPLPWCGLGVQRSLHVTACIHPHS